MSLNAEISQITFDTLTLEWKLFLIVKGETSIISITAVEAQSLINSLSFRVGSKSLEVEYLNSTVYYITKSE